MPKFTIYKGGKGGKVTKSETSKPDLKGDEVLVKVTASGLCGTDLHYREQYVALLYNVDRHRC
jgi:threonine dehydrogenase-like Zn-dependent dehydrogenase